MTSAATAKRASPTGLALSLASGVIILFGSVLPWLYYASNHSVFFGGMGGRMWGWGSGSWYVGSWIFPLALLAGIVVLCGAIMMSMRPLQARTWGIMVVVFSLLGLAGMGLSTLGSLLGIIGGAVVLSEG